MNIYIAARDEGQGGYQIIAPFSTVELAKLACENVDRNIDPEKWWLDNPAIELWRNDEYYIDRCEFDDPVFLTPPAAGLTGGK